MKIFSFSTVSRKAMAVQRIDLDLVWWPFAQSSSRWSWYLEECWAIALDVPCRRHSFLSRRPLFEKPCSVSSPSSRWSPRRSRWTEELRARISDDRRVGKTRARQWARGQDRWAVHWQSDTPTDVVGRWASSPTSNKRRWHRRSAGRSTVAVEFEENRCDGLTKRRQCQVNRSFSRCDVPHRQVRCRWRLFPDCRTPRKHCSNF